MTKEEFIGIASDAILRDQGLDPKDCALVRTQAAVAWATVALDAVGAWANRITLETVRDLHRPNGSGAYCVICDDLNEPDFPCSTHRAARMGLAL